MNKQWTRNNNARIPNWAAGWPVNQWRESKSLTVCCPMCYVINQSIHSNEESSMSTAWCMRSFVRMCLRLHPIVDLLRSPAAVRRSVWGPGCLVASSVGCLCWPRWRHFPRFTLKDAAGIYKEHSRWDSGSFENSNLWAARASCCSAFSSRFYVYNAF